MENTKVKLEILRLLIGLVMVIISIMCFNNSYGAYAEYLKGDVNSDGKVNNLDVLLTLRHIYGTKVTSKSSWCFDDNKKNIVDMNNDGNVDNIDVLMMLRYIAVDKNSQIEEKHPTWKQIVKKNSLNVKQDSVTLDLKYGQTEKLVVTGENIGNIIYSSKDSNIADVNSEGLITPHNVGETEILVKSSNGLELKVKVTVMRSYIYVQDVKIDKTNIQLRLNDVTTAKITPEVLPDNADNKSLSWTSSNPGVATVDANGNVTAIGVGETIITVKTLDGSNIERTCRVNVTKKETTILVQNIKLDKTTINLDLNGTRTAKITATIEPANASNKSVSWTSSNPGVATVDTNGNVTAVGVGSTTISIKALDGSNVTKSCQVNVTRSPIKVTSVSLNTNQLELDLTKDSHTATLTATVSPSDADNKNIKWESENPNVATVSNGVVTAVGEGSTEIIARSEDNSQIFATCGVNVIRGIMIRANTDQYLDLVNDNLMLYVEQIGANANDTITWTVDNSNVVKLVSPTNSNVKVQRVGEGTTTVRATSSSGKKAVYTVGVKTEKVLLTGASCTRLMARERKDGDTGEIQNIDYGRLQKNKTLYFVSYGGTGIMWYMDSAQRRQVMSHCNDSYGKLIVSDRYPDEDTTGISRYALREIREIINGINTKTEHLSISFNIEGNDIRKAENTAQAKYLAIIYSDLIGSFASEYQENISVYCIPKSAYPKGSNGEQYNSLIETFNKQLETIFKDLAPKNLSFKSEYYKFTQNLYATDKKSGLTADRHPNEYTTQKCFDKILEYMKITK